MTRLYWCHECKARRQVVCADYGNGYDCADCGEPILCDLCGTEWEAGHECPVPIQTDY